MRTQTNPSTLEQAASDKAGVDRWLDERRELIALYCAITRLIREGRDGALLRMQLETFRGLLLDYVSAGHFEVYSRLLNLVQGESDEADGWVGTGYPQIARSTELALAFDEDCDKAVFADTEAWMRRLSTLGEAMELRFAHEDGLLSLVREKGASLAA